MTTLLIGLDGATFTVLDPLMRDGVMPFLRDLVARGVRAQLRSTIVHVTPQAWTSLVTGQPPGEHGVLDFVTAEQTAEGLFIRLVDSRDVACDTVWAMASGEGRRAVALNFPIMFPAPQLPGCVIVPGFVSGRHLRRAMYPAGLFDTLKTVPGFDLDEIAWDMNREEKAVRTVGTEEREAWIRFHLRRERQWFEVARHLLERERADLFGVLFDGPDKLQHMAWPMIDPASRPSVLTEADRIVGGLCGEYFRNVDGYIRDLVRVAGPDARVFIASDHGFGPTEHIFYLNTWLQQHGHLVWRDVGERGQWDDMFTGRARSLPFDWQKTVAYALTPSSNGIHIRVAREPGNPGVSPDAYHTFRSELAHALEGVTDPESGDRIVSRVLTREEAFPGRQMDRAPDLTLVLRDFGFISTVRADAVVKRRPEVKGMHRYEGIFIAAGPGIRRGVEVDERSIVDVCPALLYSMGLEIPDDLAGVLPVQVFDPSLLASQPARYRRAREHAPQAPTSEADLLPHEEAAIVEQLQALGYIDPAPGSPRPRP
jgi:predicted AlkP superfamily phosphohydrolase/phosphomutase